MPVDPQSDQDFAKANPKDQHAYLMDTDPDYAKASPQDQHTYLDSLGPQQPAKPGGWETFKNDISGFLKPAGFNPYPGMGQEEKSAAAGEAYQQDQGRKAAGYSTPYRMTVPFAQSVGVNVPGMEESAKQGDIGGVLGHAAAPMAALGAAEALHQGGAAAMNALDRPVRTLARMTPILNKAGEAWRSTAPEALAHEAEMQDPMRVATRNAIQEGRAMKIPPRRLGMNAPGAAGSMAESVAPAPSSPSPTLLPEPRPGFPGENPNYMASVPRNDLNRMAINRKPGAGTQLQQLGEPILYIPNEAGYPGPRR